jgi:hypothetical protein
LLVPHDRNTSQKLDGIFYVDGFGPGLLFSIWLSKLTACQKNLEGNGWLQATVQASALLRRTLRHGCKWRQIQANMQQQKACSHRQHYIRSPISVSVTIEKLPILGQGHEV